MAHDEYFLLEILDNNQAWVNKKSRINLVGLDL